MALVRYRPLRSFFDVRDDIDSILDNFLPIKLEGEHTSAGWAPRADVAETDDEVTIAAELPGLDRKDVKINIENNVLTISGEKKQEQETDGKNYSLIERRYGAFSRSFTMPVRIEADKVKASFKDGVLSVVLPKAEEVKTKEIPIESQS